MAALTGIDSQLYEAATIDGASRLQQMFYVTLPGIKGIIVTMLIMRIGSLMQAGFEQIFVLYNPGVYDVADIIDTYVYRLGLIRRQIRTGLCRGPF
jgi:putative aldouronate transport system permease protein